MVTVDLGSHLSPIFGGFQEVLLSLCLPRERDPPKITTEFKYFIILMSQM